MSTVDVKDAVREKYAQAALTRAPRRNLMLRGVVGPRPRQSHHLETLRYRRGRFGP